MKRIFIIGVIGFVAVVILMMGALLAVLVTPARAQIGEVLGQAVERVQAAAGSTAANAATDVFAYAEAQEQLPAAQLKDENGILVAGVFEGSPADQAGLVRGDIILDIDGQAVNTRGDLNGILSQHQAGDALELLVQHGDTQKTVTVTLAEQPAAAPRRTPESGQQNNLPNRQKAPLQSGPYLGIIPIGTGQFNFKTEEISSQPGARIAQVAAGSPAEQAGLKVGEVITAVDGTPVDPQNSLGALITQHQPGDSVQLSVQGADGKERMVDVTLADHPQQTGTAYLGVGTGSVGRGRGFGVPGQGLPGEQNDLNPRNFNFPSLAEHPGALVQQVTPDSPAEEAGLKAGQVIEAVDGQKLDSPQALSEAVSAHQPGDTLRLTIYDPQADQSSQVEVTLGENPQKAGAAWLGIQYGYFNLQDLPAPQTPGSGGGTQF